MKEYKKAPYRGFEYLPYCFGWIYYNYLVMELVELQKLEEELKDKGKEKTWDNIDLAKRR